MGDVVEFKPFYRALMDLVALYKQNTVASVIEDLRKMADTLDQLDKESRE